MTYPMQGHGPGKAGLWIGSLLILLGVVGGIALVAVGARNAIDTVNHYQRVDASSGGTVSFSRAGRYVAYYERPGISRRAEIPPVQVVLTGPGGSQTLDSDIGRNGTTDHYGLNHHEGVRLTKFNVPTPGAYQVRVVGEQGSTSGDQIAFAKRSVTGGILGAVGGFLGGGLLAFIGLIVLISTIVRRGRHRRRMAQAAYAGYGYGYAAPGAWPPPAPPAAPGAPAPPWGPPPGGQPVAPAPAGQPPGWAPPPTPPAPPQPTAPGPAWPPAAPPPPPGSAEDPNRPGWGGPGR